MTKLEIHHLDVGQGDCCLIIVTDNDLGRRRTILIDCGTTKKAGVSFGRPGETLRNACENFGVDHIDVVVITHYEVDHIGGLSDLLNQGKEDDDLKQLFLNTRFYDRGEVRIYRDYAFEKAASKERRPYMDYLERMHALHRRNKSPNPGLRRMTELVLGNLGSLARELQLKSPRFTADPTPRISFQRKFYSFGGAGALLWEDLMVDSRDTDAWEVELIVVAVNSKRLAKGKGTTTMGGISTDENNQSVCVLLRMGNFKYWFPGELEEAAEEQCIAALKAMNVKALSGMKIAHHGSDHSTSEAFMDAFKPQFAVVSCGPNNVHRHPGPNVMRILDEADYIKHVYLTGYGGGSGYTSFALRAPFDQFDKFHLAGSNDDVIPGHISIDTDSDDANLPNPAFMVRYYHQNVWYNIKKGAEPVPKQRLVDSFAVKVLNNDGTPLHKNMRLDEDTGVITVRHRTTNKRIGKLFPQGDWVEFVFPEDPMEVDSDE